MDEGIQIHQGDKIAIELNLYTRKIKFTNLRTMTEKSVQILFWPDVDEDKYNFCIGASSKIDKVTLTT